MIRINLLGVPRPKQGKRSSAASMGGDGPNPLIVMIVLLVAALLGNGYYYIKITRERDKLASDMAAADNENRRLAQVKAKYDEAERQKSIFQKRADVIHSLQQNVSTGTVDLLHTIGDTVNATDAVWLSSMKDNG